MTDVALLPDMPKSEIALLDRPLKTFTENLCHLVKSELANNKPAVRSLLLAGDWGTGKTSVLKSVRHYFKPDSSTQNTQAQKPVVVFFEAWRYEYEDNLLIALLWAIAREAQKKSLDGSSKKEQIAVGLLSVGLKYVTRSSLSDIDAEIKKLEECKRKALFSELLAKYTNTDKFMFEFHNLLIKLFGDKKLLILVDDLDRCSPEAALELLEHLRRLMNITDDLTSEDKETKDAKKTNITNCFFLVAMDKTTLKQAIQHKFADLSNYDSNRYLEKIFPVTLQLPEICHISDESLKDILRGSEGSSDNITDQEKDDIKAIFKQPYFKNSRLFIRCFNQIKIIQQFDEDEQVEKVGLLHLLEWLAAINRWPDLRRFVRNKNDNFWETVEMYLNGKVEGVGHGIDSLESLVSKGEYKELLEHPNIREFLSASHVFGSIHNEKTLPKKITEYRKCDDLLQQRGI